jgi:endonuclease/exonuclease/phosphatase family metal-dependent hydrolase
MPMKIVQYNIYFGDHPKVDIESRLENICKCLLGEDADVVCLQEVLQTTYNLITGLLADTYPYAYPDPRLGLRMSYDTVIFSKHPIKTANSHKYEFTTMGRGIRLVKIQKDQAEIYISTTHFESEFKGECSNKRYQYDKCSDVLYQIHRNTNIPIFLCSDTNVCKTTEASFHNSFTYAKGWRDAWIESGSDKETEITFDSDTNPILIERYCKAYKQTYRSRLDRILHLSGLHCTEFRLLGTDPRVIMSDHYGIVCTFSKTKPETRGNYIPPWISERDKDRVPGKREQIVRGNSILGYGVGLNGIEGNYKKVRPVKPQYAKMF